MFICIDCLLKYIFICCEIWIFYNYSFLIYVDCPIYRENQLFHLVFCLFTNVQLFKILLFLSTTILLTFNQIQLEGKSEINLYQMLNHLKV